MKVRDTDVLASYSRDDRAIKKYSKGNQGKFEFNMWLLTEFRFNFVGIADYKLSIYPRYTYTKNTVYGCDSGKQNIFCEL